jgi:hypothetical protein
VVICHCRHSVFVTELKMGYLLALDLCPVIRTWVSTSNDISINFNIILVTTSGLHSCSSAYLYSRKYVSMMELVS